MDVHVSVEPPSLTLEVPSPPSSARVATSMVVTSAPAAPTLLYRLQATAPGRYAVSPAAGVLWPGVPITLRVVLRAVAKAEATAAAVAAAGPADTAGRRKAGGGVAAHASGMRGGEAPGLVDKFLLQVVAAPPLVVSAFPTAAEVRAAWPTRGGGASGVRIPCLLRPMVTVPPQPLPLRPPHQPMDAGEAAAASASPAVAAAMAASAATGVPPDALPSVGSSESSRRGRSPSTSSDVGSPPSGRATAVVDGSEGDLVAANPSILAFPSPSRGRSTLSWTLTSRHPDATLLVKVATNAPARYTVAPNVVTLRPGHPVTVVVHRSAGEDDAGGVEGSHTSRRREGHEDRLQLVTGVLPRPPPEPLSAADALAAHRRLPATALRRQKHRCTVREASLAEAASWEEQPGRRSLRTLPSPRQESTSLSSGGTWDPYAGRSESPDGGAVGGRTPVRDDPPEEDAWAWHEPWAVETCTGGAGGGASAREDDRRPSTGWGPA
ncbi:hypothetical protein MMPV_004268 [Pyropia vietnamensis]